MIVMVISPDDYDAAVARSPRCCPLYTAGDTRCVADAAGGALGGAKRP